MSERVFYLIESLSIGWAGFWLIMVCGLYWAIMSELRRDIVDVEKKITNLESEIVGINCALRELSRWIKDCERIKDMLKDETSE